MLLLDAGAVTAATEDPRARAILRRAQVRKEPVGTSAVIVAEVTTGRGPLDAKANRVLAGLTIFPVDEQLARRAGGLRFQAGSSATVDACLVATAEASGPGSAVLTGDLVDLRALASVARGVMVETWT